MHELITRSLLDLPLLGESKLELLTQIVSYFMGLVPRNVDMAREITERDLQTGLRLAHPEAVKYIEPQIRLAEKVGKRKKEYKLLLISDRSFEKIKNLSEARIEEVFTDSTYGKEFSKRMKDWFWIDTADKQPCIATGGMIPWTLKATGKLFHSGLAHKLLSLLLPATFSSGLVQMLPATFSSGLVQIASLTDLYFSSFVPGVAAGLSYAYILAMAPLGILSSIIILPVVPTFSTLAEPSMWVRLQENLEKAILLCLEFSKRRKDW